MTEQEKIAQYKPKSWALYCNNNFIESFPSHKAAKRALHKKMYGNTRIPI